MAFGDIYVVIKFRSMFCSIIRHKRKAQHNLFCLTIISGYDETTNYAALDTKHLIASADQANPHFITR